MHPEAVSLYSQLVRAIPVVLRAKDDLERIVLCMDAKGLLPNPTDYAKESTAQAIKAKTDNLPAQPASRTDVQPNITVNPTPVTINTDLSPVVAAIEAIPAPIVSIDIPSVLPGVSVPAGDLPGIRRGDSYSATITGISSLSTADEVWLTAKSQGQYASRQDSQSEIQASMTEGLLWLSRSVANPTDGSLTVSGEGLTLTLSAEATALLTVQPLRFDVQVLQGDQVKTVHEGNVQVVADVTRAV